MTDKHLSEAEIQQCAVDSSTCDRMVLAHMLACEHCRAKVGNYRILFSQLKEMPKPVFEFDLPALVLEKLPAHTPELSWVIFVASFFSLACIGIVAFVLRDYLISIFRGISLMLLCLIVVSAIIISIFQTIDIYKRYQRKMDNLNLY